MNSRCSRNPVYRPAIVVLLLIAMPLTVLADEAIPFERKDADLDASPVDLVFCLDISGSMQSLLDAVRIHLWDVVNEFGGMSPTPDLRVGLVSYGTQRSTEANGWIRFELDLSRDLDDVYAGLFDMTANGATEYAGWALQTALDSMSWSDDPNALKIIFLAGNERADQGAEHHDFRHALHDAQMAEVIVNTVYAGGLEKGIAEKWSEVAELGNGLYAAIRSTRVQQISTPQDEPLSQLNAQLNATYVPFGDEGASKLENVTRQDENATKLGAQALSNRILAKTSDLYDTADWDLVDAAQAPGFDWAALNPSDLREELRGLSEADLLAAIEEKRIARQELRRKIRELGGERRRHVRAEMAKKPRSGSVGDAMLDAIRSQARERGFYRDEQE